MALPVHVSEVPEFDVRGDCVRVVWRDVEAFVPIPIAQAAMGRCKLALREWGETRAKVIEFPVAAE